MAEGVPIKLSRSFEGKKRKKRIVLGVPTEAGALMALLYQGQHGGRDRAGHGEGQRLCF